ncbi:MAG TPA: hypothetical protein DDZ51_27385 [Planctomycetaceae bacterium]|nr:hypothetical protein [Planctomycetaceae bacterium]
MHFPPAGLPTCRSLLALSLTALIASLSIIETASSFADDHVDYQRDVKALLKERCFACHGALQQQGELRLDSGELIRRGGDSGAAIVVGDSAASLLIERITDPDATTRMPPEGEPLSASQIDALRQWIDRGATTPEDDQPEQDPRLHWAFQPIERPEVPANTGSQWGQHPIDAFIASHHQRLGLRPQVAAEAPLLVRRLYTDLIGMPPSPAELVELLGSNGEIELDDQAYRNLVERLLNDPRHGERWARHWMDIWRYSDWWGLGSQLRNSQQHMWHWRDWIVESLNDDLPYDQMVRLMLAGDELSPTDMNHLRATGFLARNFFLFNRHQWMDETVEHVSKSFLGLTMNCSKCHDHKYDPLPQADYYRMRAFFEPYHVRLDLLPGESNYDRNALPRVFDALLDAPTYLFVRGEEANPDKSQVIPPGVPEILGFKQLEIQPLALPPEAWETERRVWVQELYLADAKQKVIGADTAIAQAKQNLQAAESQHAEMLSKSPGKTEASNPNDSQASPADQNKAGVVFDDFKNLDSSRWQLVDGKWDHQPGKLQQSLDGPQRAAVRLLASTPRDFDATVKFTTLGGSKWRSVGIAFDVDAKNENTKSSADQHQHVYVSAVSGGSKVQAAYRKSGSDNYPGDAMRGMPIELNKQYTLRIRTQGDLINVDLDGTTVVAWRSPLPRRDGALQLTTFDAIAVFHEFSLQPLDPTAKLQEPKGDLKNPTTPEQTEQLVKVAAAKLQIAELTKVSAESELASLQNRIAAMNQKWKLEDNRELEDITRENSDTASQQNLDQKGVAESSHRDAIKSQRVAKVAELQLAIAELELQKLSVTEDKLPGIEKQLSTEKGNLEKANAAIDSEVTSEDKYQPIVGAKWSATRFMSSGADDAKIDFPATSTGRRTALANWITDRNHPLTARVAVNHIWTRHFGTPLVDSVFDFGRNGTAPTHPELLDWLAAEFIESGWSMKHIHRLIAESSTYRMSSSNVDRDHEMVADVDNRNWWRRNPMRVESQVVRDTILSLAGKLDLTRGGPTVPLGEQTDSNRRSLYFFHSNNERNLFLTMFDEATVTECYRREESIVPQQALALTNSRLVLDSILPIAERLTQSSRSDSQDDKTTEIESERDRFIRLAFLALVGFAPTEQEILASRAAFDDWLKLPNTPESLARSYFVWTLLNHTDFVTLR